MARLNSFPKNELIQQYRKVFSSKDGQDVLAHMLWELGLFSTIDDSKEEIALKNYAIRIVSYLSGGEPEGDNIKNFLLRLMKQPLTKEHE